MIKPTNFLSDNELKMADMWGLGVILHELLSKTLPFDLRLTSTSDHIANMTAQTWKAVSLQAVDFVQQLLTKDPNDRLSDPRNAAQHYWIKEATLKCNQVINKNLRVTKCFENMI
jgi:serine/threonine protein kinase